MGRAGPNLLSWVVLLVGLALVGMPVAKAWQSPGASRQIAYASAETSIRRALEAYASGDDLAVGRWIGTPGGVAALPSLEAFFKTHRELWNRTSALFVLEAAIAGPPRRMFGMPPLLVLGRTMLLLPGAAGGAASASTFELLWHQTAVGVAQGWLQYWSQQEYVEAVASRVEEAEDRGVAGETRMPLARAIAAAGVCCWKPIHSAVIQIRVFSTRRPTVTLDQAVALFERAAERPWLRTEALVRGAVTLHGEGRDADALRWFARVPAHRDGALGYVHHVTRARLLDSAGRTAEAIAAYEAALSFTPSGQVASIGLAAALLRLGRTAEAGREADKARQMPADDGGPFVEFARADARFVPTWLTALRRLRTP